MSIRISELTDTGTLTGAELVELSRPSATITIAAATISAQASDNSFNDSASGFVAAGFAVGDSVRVQGFTGDVANNLFSARVTVLTGGKMTIGGSDGDAIVDDAAGESVTIAKWESWRAFTAASASPLIAAPAFSATPTIDTTAAELIYFGALTANVTAFNLAGTRAKVIVAFKQDGTGGRTVTAGTSIDFGADIPNLAALAATANAYTYVGFIYHPTTAKFRVVALSK